MVEALVAPLIAPSIPLEDCVMPIDARVFRGDVGPNIRLPGIGRPVSYDWRAGDRGFGVFDECEHRWEHMACWSAKRCVDWFQFYCAHNGQFWVTPAEEAPRD